MTMQLIPTPPASMYGIVQVADGKTCVIKNYLYTSLEDAQKDYLELCEKWYPAAAWEAIKDNKIKHWMKEPPMLVQLNNITVLSPTSDNYFDEIKDAYKTYSEKTDSIDNDMGSFKKQAHADFKNSLDKALSVK